MLRQCAFLSMLYFQSPLPIILCSWTISQSLPRGHVFSSSHLFSSTWFLFPLAQAPLNLLPFSLFSLLSFVTQLLTTWTCWTPPVAPVTWKLQHSAYLGYAVLATFSFYFPALCFSPLYLCPPIFWPHLFLIPAGSWGIWKWNSPTARLVSVRHRPNGCSETPWHLGWWGSLWEKLF